MFSNASWIRKEKKRKEKKRKEKAETEKCEVTEVRGFLISISIYVPEIVTFMLILLLQNIKTNKWELITK